MMALPVLYLQQRAVTTRALTRASLISFCLAAYNIPIVWLMDISVTQMTAHYVTMFTGSFPLFIMGWVCLRPSERANKTTRREYGAFVGVYYILRLSYGQLFYKGDNYTNATFTLIVASIFWGSFIPVVVWRVLKADTAHWRGLGRRAVHLQSMFRQKYNCLHERVSSRGLHVLIEMHRKQIIDFAYLELHQKIGAGANAVVFRGTLHCKTPVAVKVYTPHVLTEDVVAEFSHEAALCGAFHHPNVVHFYGMCVSPPTICLVSELCRASLEDITRISARLRLPQNSRQEERKQVSTLQHRQRQRQRFLVDLNYMIDATRAVVYMHSFTPAFLHRDLKPSNFLVDEYGICKLTDFGESRSVPAEHKGNKLASITANDSSKPIDSTRSITAFYGDSYQRVQTPVSPYVMPPMPLRPSMRDRGRSAMTVRGTADYMAPELIEGKAGTAVYGEAADIYSLAITLWDIANPLVPKYPEAAQSHLHVFDSVLNGERPSLSPSLHPELIRLFTDAWHQQPERRPSATYILRALEDLQQQTSAQTALQLAMELERSEAQATLVGQGLMQRMLELGFVDSAPEAYRMGNAFMSAGFLHHSHHCESYRNTSEQFYFDVNVLYRYASDTPGRTQLTPSPPQSSDLISERVSLTTLNARLHSFSKKQLHQMTNTSNATCCFTQPIKSRQRSSSARLQAGAEQQTCVCRILGCGLNDHERRYKRRFGRGKKRHFTMEGSAISRKFEDNLQTFPADGLEDYGVCGTWDGMEPGDTTYTNVSNRIDEDAGVDLDSSESSDIF